MIYVFRSANDFSKYKDDELEFLNKEDVAFSTVSGVTNPWFVHPIVNGKVDNDTILSPSELDSFLQRRFE